MYVYDCKYIYLYIYISIYISVYICICIYIYILCHFGFMILYGYNRYNNTRLATYINVSVYIYIHTYVYIYVYIYMYIYICISHTWLSHVNHHPSMTLPAGACSMHVDVWQVTCQSYRFLFWRDLPSWWLAMMTIIGNMIRTYSSHFFHWTKLSPVGTCSV
jgi:hypothetical protein